MIKAIIFDYGNVIEKINNDIFLRAISSHTQKSMVELRGLVYNSDLPEKYEKGMMSSGEFYQEVVKRCKLSISIPDFIDAYTGVSIPIPATFDLMRKLKKKYKLALISNTSEWDFERIIMPSEVYGLFDAVTISCRVKMMKPANDIYLDALNKLKLSPDECVYIDDVKEYVEGACKNGIKGIQYKSHDGLLKSLRKLKVSI